MGNLPKRIILSRKGVDAKAGGFPSLIVNDKLLSIPIPEPEFDHDTKYSDIRLPADFCGFSNMGALIEAITKRRKNPLPQERLVHLDPDIRYELVPESRRATWRAAFGQSGVPDVDLKDVEERDLFLFFGWFDHAEVKNAGIKLLGRDQHVLWGWLEVGKVDRDVAIDGAGHVHQNPRKESTHMNEPNSLYYASDTLSFRPATRGYGVFVSYDQKLRLTHPACRQGCRSLWRLPSFFEGGLTGIGKEAPWTLEGNHTVVQAVGQHQEYVFELSRETCIRAEEWLHGLFDLTGKSAKA
jgi:hypothetical protein